MIMPNMSAVPTVRLCRLIIRTTSAASVLPEMSNNKSYENETVYIDYVRFAWVGIPIGEHIRTDWR